MCESDNNKYALIIEDKTNTSEHSNQIKRYIDIINKDEDLKIMHDNIFVAYVKTGIIYDYDRLVKGNIVDLEQLLDTMRPFVETTKSEILADYVEYLSNEWNKRNNIKDLIDSSVFDGMIRLSESDKEIPVLGTYYGQYYFMNSMFPDRDISKRIIVSNENDENEYEHTDCIYAGSNNDGSPWTQYCFWGGTYPCNVTNFQKRESHWLFWRVDKYTPRGRDVDKKNKYYLALRHYDYHAHSKIFQQANERKEKVYKQLRDACDNICKNNELIITKIGNRSSYKESDLVYIPIDNLLRIGNGTIEEIQHFLNCITQDILKVAKNIIY